MKQVAKNVLLLVLFCICGVPGHAETPPSELKLQVQLDAGVIKVEDLWTHAGARGSTVIGPAPPPGRTIAVEAGQLAYIAHLYDVDWRPVSGVERTVVERLGRSLTYDEVIEPIKRNLIESGASSTITVELSNFAPILVPPLSSPVLSVEAMAYDPGSQRFSADLVASTDGMQTQRMRVSGRGMQMATAMVATHRLEPTDVIGPGDVRAMQFAERRLAGPVAVDVAQVVGQTPKRTIGAGQPLAMADLGPPILVAKGATVVMMLETPSMSLAAQGLALGSGSRDDVIQVMNPLSRAVVAARIAGPGRAIIIPGSTPLVAPTNGAASRNREVAD